MKEKGKRVSKVWIAVVLLAIVMAGGQANASIVSYTYTFASAAAPFTYTFTLGTFDTNLGTLNSVNLYTKIDMSATVRVVNLTGSAQSFTGAYANLPVTVTPPAPATPVTTTATVSGISGSVGAGMGPYYFPGTPTSTEQNTPIPSGQWSAFQTAGGGTANFSASTTSGSYGGSSVPKVYFGGSASAGGTVRIDYTYTPKPPDETPLPLPSALLLLAPGLIGLAIVRRRVKR